MMPGTPTEIVPTPPATELTYDQSAQLMTDYTFKGRVKTACLKYAMSITNEASNAPAHSSRMRWAQSCYLNPDGVAAQIQPPTVMDPNVQSTGSAITDETLQGAVEAVANSLI